MAKIVQLDTRTIIGGVVTTLVVGGVVGAISYSRIIELDHYRITTNALAIEKLDVEKLDVDLANSQFQSLGDKIDGLSDKFDIKFDLLKKEFEKRR